MPKIIWGSVWPDAGDRVHFLGRNGYDSELKRAMEVFEVGKYYTVAECDIGSSSSTFLFEEVPGWWNTVMFQYDHDLEEERTFLKTEPPIPETWK